MSTFDLADVDEESSNDERETRVYPRPRQVPPPTPAGQNRQLLEGLLVAVQLLTNVVNQRLPAPPPTQQATVTASSANPGPPPNPSTVGVASLNSTPQAVTTPPIPSPSVIQATTPAEYTFEALGAGPNLYLDTPNARIPLVRRVSQLSAIPLQWDQDDTTAFQTAQATPTATLTPTARSVATTAPAVQAPPPPSATAPAAQSAPPPPAVPTLPNAAANHFAGLVSGISAGNRRLSQTTRAVRGSTDLSANTPTQVVLHPPKHDIELTSLSVNAIIKFVTDVIDYQYRYRIPLQVPSLLRPSIVREIMARHPRLNYATFQALDADQVFQLLQFEMAPSTPYEVINRLDRSVRFKLDDSKYRPSSRDYRPFYSALLTYIREFTLAYDLITGLLPADLIPKLSTKDLGILKVFLSKIPFEYGWRLHSAYLQDNVNPRGAASTSLASNNQTITNFHRYLSAFGQYVNQHFNVYRDCRTFEQFFGGTSYHGGSNLNRPRHRTQHVNAIMPPALQPSETDSTSSDVTDDDPYPDDMVFPEQEDTLDDGNMYGESETSAFTTSAADSQLSLAEAHAQDALLVEEPSSLNAIPSSTSTPSQTASPVPFRGSPTPRPPAMPQRKPSTRPDRSSSPSPSAHSTVHAYGHRRSSDTRYPADDKRRPRIPSSSGAPSHPNTPPWKRPQSPSDRSS